MMLDHNQLYSEEEIIEPSCISALPNLRLEIGIVEHKGAYHSEKNWQCENHAFGAIRVPTIVELIGIHRV